MTMEERMYFGGKLDGAGFGQIASTIVSRACYVNATGAARVNVHMDNGQGVYPGSLSVHIYRKGGKGGNSLHLTYYHTELANNEVTPDGIIAILDGLLAGKEVEHA